MPERDTATAMPDPAPGFISLVLIHLRLLIREARAGSAILALICVLLPLAALAHVGGAEPAQVVQGGPGRVPLLIVAMMGLTFFLAYLWPESVWRNLGPGERLVLDAFPVSRRSQRMARVVAGSVLPLMLLASVVVAVAIMEAHGWGGGGMRLSPDEAPGLHGVGILVTLTSLLSAYAFSSILALRFGKVFVSLLIIFGVAYLVPVLLMLMGFEGLVAGLLEWAGTSPASPFPVLTLWYQGTAENLPAGLAWLLIFSGAAVYMAGRYDRA